jgi:hypothetical protein
MLGPGSQKFLVLFFNKEPLPLPSSQRNEAKIAGGLGTRLTASGAHGQQSAIGGAADL